MGNCGVSGHKYNESAPSKQSGTILLLGGSGVGKSTIFKQFQICFGKDINRNKTEIQNQIINTILNYVEMLIQRISQNQNLGLESTNKIYVS